MLGALAAENANLRRDKRCRAISDTFEPPRRPRVVPQLTSSSSAVITLVELLRLIILDFGMHCHCLHLLAPHSALF